MEHIPPPDPLLASIDRFAGRSDEQHALIDGMRHILDSDFSSVAEAKCSALELLPFQIVLSSSVLKSPINFQILRQVLRKIGITVEQKHGLLVSQAVSEALYRDDDNMIRTDREEIKYFKSCRSGEAPARSNVNTSFVSSHRVAGSKVSAHS